MSDDWRDDGIEAEPFDVDDDVRKEREPGRVFGIDVAELIDGMARPAILRALQKSVRDVANEVVDAEVEAQLDPTVIEELQAQAATAARRSVAAALDELDEPADEEPELYFGSVDEFVRGYLLPNYRRRVDGQRVLWAAQWWKYAEAVARLDALWRAWEHLRQDAQTGMSVWFRDHAEHHMSILLSADGPFAAAGEGKERENTNEKGQPLPYIAPPEGLFPDVRCCRSGTVSE
ncbi:MAG: DUF4913 domain-containing protein [Microbacterium sp.]|nr:DUF4913 domain-containing protein [Microbacterium sp.]|tara:strand:- start:1304 stop:2002 length:699 start_codon:yes stop_codon:yes gene_type:complete